MKPVNPAGSVGMRVISHHPVPFEYTEEGLEAAAMRVPAPVAPTPAALNKAADSVIAEITGANVPSGTAGELSDEELEAATAPK